MPLTYTDRIVRPGGTEHPSLIDIAVGLSRQPRFAGQGRQWFSVLDHTLFCDELAKTLDNYSEESVVEARLAVLLHDAHEAVTADVPSDMKGQDLKYKQREIDVGIYEAFFPGGYYHHYIRLGWDLMVKTVDRLALVAEAHVVGPPSSPERITELFGGVDGLNDAEATLSNLLDKGTVGVPPNMIHQEYHPAVMEFLKRMNTLR